ncbi:LOW QUALITY PROTEIN: Fanconi anemia group F protein [Phascolarctos cinereus]|uniref:Fanconi anemia group F protein n=1 Tax=Phascolarctos cinereus TaxID=38626 RepID=A0A6P5LHP3_PHACI|nr:LOW QUALITY PROTEIN: Fanconi anemia group F protein [Phascolarctos cinereus]
MELLLEQLERFAEVLAASRTRHAGSWGRVAVRRSLRWARYLRHVHGRFRRRGPVRAALEEGLRGLRLQAEAHAGPCSASGPGQLRSFEGLGRADQLLALGLLDNAAVQGPALHELLRHLRPEREEPEGPEDESGLRDRLAELARRRAASQLLLQLLGPGPSPAQAEPVLRRTEAELLLLRLHEEPEVGAEALLLDRLWVQLPRPRWLDVVTEALLLQPMPRPDRDEDEEDPGSQTDLGQSAAEPLLAWLLAHPAALATLCRLLPAPVLASLAAGYSALAKAFLDLLAQWGSRLHFDLIQGTWVGTGPERLSWERLRDCFRCFCQCPASLRNEALRVLKDYRTRDGSFGAPGLSVWTDLLQDLGENEPPGEAEAAEPGAEMPGILDLGCKP